MEENTVGKINKGILKIGALMMVLALVMIAAIPASADDTTPTPAALHTVQGIVTSISNTSDTGSFVLQYGNQQQVTITTNTSTVYYLINPGKAQGFVNKTINQNNQKARRNGRSLPPKANDLKNAHIPANWRDNLGWLETFNKQASFTDIAIGDRIIARVDSNDLAHQVLIIKAPVIQTIKGSVTLTDPTHITITPSTGSPVTLNVVDTTRIVIKGQTSISGYAVAVYNSTNDNALIVNVQAAAPTPSPNS